MPKRNSIRRLHNLVWNTGNVDSARESTSTQYVYLVKGMMMFAAFWTNLTAQSRPACGVYVWSGGAGKAYKRGINEFSTYVHDTHIECRNIYPCQCSENSWNGAATGNAFAFRSSLARID